MADGDKPYRCIEATGRAVVNGRLKNHAESAASLSPHQRLKQEAATNAVPPVCRRHPQTQNFALASDGPAQDKAGGIARPTCNETEGPRHLENPGHRIGGPGVFKALLVKRGQNVGVLVADRNKLRALYGAHRRALTLRRSQFGVTAGAGHR
jgi:hypothetical protein